MPVAVLVKLKHPLKFIFSQISAARSIDNSCDGVRRKAPVEHNKKQMLSRVQMLKCEMCCCYQLLCCKYVLCKWFLVIFGLNNKFESKCRDFVSECRSCSYSSEFGAYWQIFEFHLLNKHGIKFYGKNNVSK